jgi:hypothetical protein
MKPLLFGFAVLAVLLSPTGRAAAEFITFDDLAPSIYLKQTNAPGQGMIQGWYKGLQWDNFSALNTLYASNPSGYQVSAVSGSWVAVNALGQPAEMTAPPGGSFTFIGASFTAAWNDGLQIQVDGYARGSLLYSKTVVVDTNSPQSLTFDYQDVDRLRFTSFGGNHARSGGGGENFAMDNFNFSGVQLTPAPAPPGFLLAVIGATSLFGSRAWRRRKAAVTAPG